jgi:acetyl-CoA C-acetyltransferase
MTRTPYRPNLKRYSIPEMVYEVVNSAMESAGAKIEDIDQVITASQDFMDGRTISNRTISEACGSYLKPEAKASSDGIFAIFYATLRILSGHFETATVVSHCKMSEGAQNIIANASFDPYYQELLGLDDRSSSALQARQYMERYGIKEEQLALVAVKNLRNGSKNPDMHRGKEIKIEDVMKSPVLASPIKELDAYTISDGACAIILASDERAKRFAQKPVWIEGMATCMDAYYLGDRNLWESKALELAASKAYRMAGITDPRKEIDLAEISELYTYQELLWSEGLGLCEKGEGASILERGISSISGDLPINPSGGVLSGKPLVVAGMDNVLEAATQLLGKAKERQVDCAKRAIAHGVCGPCGQSHCVIVLGI